MPVGGQADHVEEKLGSPRVTRKEQEMGNTRRIFFFCMESFDMTSFGREVTRCYDILIRRCFKSVKKVSILIPKKRFKRRG